jgi:sialic acid synthase SpsE
MLNENDRVLVIAEIGTNHDGSLSKALDLIDIAVDSGADIAKFQSFLADEMVAKSDANYPMLKRLEMPQDWYPILIKHCSDRGIRFLSTATNFLTLGWMEDLDVWGYKVASCNVSHTPLIDKLIDLGRPVIISTGLATLEEIIELSQKFDESSVDAAFLHCVSEYPCPPERMNIKNITVLSNAIKQPVGLSDHSKGYNLASAAIALGATVLEKHLTNNRDGYSPDHQVSLLPGEFSAMVAAVREIEQSLTSGFCPNPEAVRSMRRSLHFGASLPRGHIIAESDIKVVRPEGGLPPADLYSIIGCTLVEPVTEGQPLTLDLIR